MACKEGCSEEFKRSNFLLSGEDPKRFITSEWSAACGGCHLWFVLWRVLWALLFIIAIILDWTVDYGWYDTRANKIKWFINLVSWSLIISALDTILSAITSIHGYRKHKEVGSFDDAIPEMTWYLKLQWVLSNAGMTLGIAVNVLYWVLLYLPVRFELHWMHILLHGPNAAYYILNLFITAQPLRVYHAWHSLLIGLAFGIFTLTYDLVGGTNARGQPGVSAVVQWREAPGRSVGTILALELSLLVVWLLLYALYRIRRAITSEVMKNSPEVTSQHTVYTHTVPKSNGKKAIKSKIVGGHHVSVVEVYQ